MVDIIDKGYVRKVDFEKLVIQKGKVWYLFYYGIYYSKKLSSIRVVFNCLVRYQGELFNDYFLQGFDLISKLIGVLIRFR